MDIFAVFTLLGGLAIFLFGMNVMGESLEKSSGGRLKSVLEGMTSNCFKGVLLGAGVTAIIQSSSATTVMVVGFVNSGILKLSQAISIIMGANIGTTITAWLLSLTGIESSNIFVQLLKPSSFSPLLAFVGIILYMFVKDAKKKDIGTILLGFAILITGMELMSGAVSGLKDNESFTSILTLFSNPILGVITGAVITGIIQSSSASVGILQALSTTGSISYANAVPIILGQNIGTCVTAMLSSIGTNKNARRTAIVHLCFNIIGTFVFLIVFYLIHFLVGFAFMENSINAAGIAVVHTIFNIFATVIMLPFIKGLEKLACFIIKDDETKQENQLLDERLLKTPSIAIAHAKKVTKNMALMAKTSLLSALMIVENYDNVIAQQIIDDEEKIDMYEDKLGTYLVKLSRIDLNYENSHETACLLHSIGDFERISDHAINLVEAANEIQEKNIAFSKEATNEISVMSEAVAEILELTYKAFAEEDLETAKKIEPLEQIIDKLKIQLKSNHIKRLQKGDCTIEVGFVFSDLINNYERIADHCSNVAVSLLTIVNDGFETHEYLNHVKTYGENEFLERYSQYQKKYSIQN